MSDLGTDPRECPRAFSHSGLLLAVLTQPPSPSARTTWWLLVADNTALES